MWHAVGDVALQAGSGELWRTLSDRLQPPPPKEGGQTPTCRSRRNRKSMYGFHVKGGWSTAAGKDLSSVMVAANRITLIFEPGLRVNILSELYPF
jgi:hypothetical protein